MRSSGRRSALRTALGPRPQRRPGGAASCPDEAGFAARDSDSRYGARKTHPLITRCRHSDPPWCQDNRRWTRLCFKTKEDKRLGVAAATFCIKTQEDRTRSAHPASTDSRAASLRHRPPPDVRRHIRRPLPDSPGSAPSISPRPRGAPRSSGPYRPPSRAVSTRASNPTPRALPSHRDCWASCGRSSP